MNSKGETGPWSSGLAEAGQRCGSPACPPQVSEMVRKLHRAAPPTFGADLIQELVESFGRCPRWSGRQAFVFVCQVRAPFTPVLSLSAELCYLGTPPPPRPLSSLLVPGVPRFVKVNMLPGLRCAPLGDLLHHVEFLSAQDISLKVVTGL